MDSTKLESTSATTTQPSQQAEGPSIATPDTPDRVRVEAPSKGEVRVVDVQNADEIAFNFDLKNVRVSAIDVDLVLLFPDNSKLILPGLAMGLLGAKAPKLRSLNQLVQSQDIVSAISQVNLAETTPSVHLASADFLPKKQGGNAADDKASADGSENAEQSRAAADVVVTPVRPNVVIEINKTGSASGAKVEVVEAGSIASSKLNLANAGGEPPAPKTLPSSSSSQSSSAAQGNAPFSMNAADVKIKALAIAGSSETPQSDGKILVGGSGASAAAEDASFAAQTARESLSGGSGNDIIYADDPRFSNSGSAARLLDVTVTMPTSNVSATQATISGLPSGYSILNANFINGNWVLPVGSTKPNNFQIQLVYKLPDDSIQPDANGFYSRFNMSMTFTGTNGSGGNGTISATTVVGVRDVNAAEDQNFIDPASGKPVVILYRRPAGNEISAGQGNDTVYAAAGADSIDGGNGSNLVHYGNSQSGVSVSLATGTGSGGFAQGDQFVNIQSVVGSKFGDTLIGNDDDNRLAGQAGADSLSGGGGNDIADYSGSSSAITVNLTTGEGTGGDAQGDKLNGIEAAIGSSNDDIFVAGIDGSTLWGEQGNDTFISGAGADSFAGGVGENLVDYRNSINAIQINLKAKTAFGGDAEGDQYSFIEHIGGSIQDDTIIGDDSDNLLDGNLGDDSLDGGLGNDTLQAGGGNDILHGGAGNDLLVAAAGSSTLFGGFGNDTFNGTDGNATVDYQYAATGVLITLNETNTATSFVSGTDRDVLIGINDIRGSDYGDTISGNGLNNVLFGGEGGDALAGGTGADTLQGDKGDDTLNGGTGEDLLLGGDDQDLLTGGTGNDTLDGGANNDTIDYSYVFGSGTTNGINGITVTLNGATNANVTGLATGDQDTIRNVEHVTGTSFNDSITGDANANSLFGGDGLDTLVGSGSADTLDGGAGNDCLIGTGGADIMRGGTEHDYMLIDQTFLGGGGSIDGGTGMDTVSFAANSGNLTLTNANFDNIVTNAEVLDFTSVGTNVTMSLNATDISSITGQGLGTNNKLDIFQNAGDQISIATQAGYSFDTTSSNGVTTYTFYNSTDPHDPANQLAQINVHGS